MNNIFDLFDTARKHLKEPSIKIPIEPEIQLKLLPSRKYADTRINIYVNTAWIGRIIKDNVARCLSIRWDEKQSAPSDDIKSIVRELVKNPIGICAVIGQKQSHCCFCGITITTKESLAVGYGPICAEKWGLPWGQLVLKELESKNL